MTPERVRQIEELYHAVREGTADQRASLLARADPDVRREVESLLARADGEFLDRPAIQNAPQLLEDATVTIFAAGARLGPYRIESKLGEGGMGEVFRAIDTRLGRAVAVKTSRDQFSDRFEREARAISSLNHPNICTLYDVGANYLVMELVEGETLAARLKRGPLSSPEAIQYARQIAAALVEAHAKGVIHRDLKPGNIMIAKSGVKVLDFGLAKSAEDETITASRMVMGTPAYMPPEQRQGQTADERSDIYSFGCVLYEMLTGSRVGSQRKRIRPAKLEKIVTRCLEEDPARRWQTAAELANALESSTGDARPWKIASAVAAAVVVLAAASYFFLHRAPKLTEKDTIVLADFENKTGDPVFDDTLRQGLIVQLQQSPYLNVISDQKIRVTLKLMGKPVDSPLTEDTAREVCERVGAKAILAGGIASLGSQYVLNLRAEGCANGDDLDNQQAQASGKDEVLKTLSDMAGKFRAHAGESLAAIREHNVPLDEATTSSLEALKAYTAALDLNGDAQLNELRRATELDPAFASAWSLLAIQYSNRGEAALSRQSATRAYQLRERASGPEKFNIDYSYYRNVTGDLEKAWQSISLWRQTYPRDSHAFSLSGGYAANGTGRLEEVVKESTKSVEIEPDQLYGYTNLANALFRLGRMEEAEKAYAVAAAHHATGGDAVTLRYRLAALKQDKAGMQKILADSREDHDSAVMLEHVQALAAANLGHLKEAEQYSRSAVELATRAGLRERTAVFQAAPAVWNAFYENKGAARSAAEVALKTFEGRDVIYAAGFALGLAGEAMEAAGLADKLDKEYPEDTQVQATYVPTLRALAALARNDPHKAIDLLEANRPYEFGIPPLAFNDLYGNMYPLYVRGLAYLATGKAEEAVAEFTRLLAHTGLTAGDPVEAAARRQLARAWGLAGDKAKARSAYQEFLTAWKDADQDIPMLTQVKAEYAKLP